MLAAVGFNDETSLDAVKIDDVTCDRDLATKLETLQPPVAKN
jgi:hypothetical protein